MNLIYIVSLKPMNAQWESLCGGIWGAYSSLAGAMKHIRSWMDEYNEKQLDYIEQRNGLRIIVTDKSRWVIEGVVVDED